MDKAYTESWTSSRNDITTVTDWYWPPEIDESQAEEERVIILGTLQPECFNLILTGGSEPEGIKVIGLDEMAITRAKELFDGY